MARVICGACNKPIKEGEASLTENTLSTSRHWHLRCCPLIKKPEPVPAGQEHARESPLSQPDWPLLEHVRSRTVEEPNRGCWLWARSLNRTGYNNTMTWPRYLGGDGRQRHAHTLAYMALKGPVPAGIELDHLCRDRRCVNPYHLEAVTPAVNHLRNRIGEDHPLTAWQMAEHLARPRSPTSDA